MYTTVYPTAIPSRTNLPVWTDDVDDVEAIVVNDPVTELLACMTELGTLPSGSAASLAARLAVSLNDDGSLKSTLSPTFADLTLSGNLTVNGGNITSTTGALSFGNETLTTLGNVGFGAAHDANTKLKLTYSSAISTSYGQVIDYDFTGSGNLYGAHYGLKIDVQSTSTSAKNYGDLYGAYISAFDDSTSGCSNYNVRGLYVFADSDHATVPCYAAEFSATGLGVNYALYAAAANGSANYSFYGETGILFNTDGVRIGTNDTDHMIDEASNGAATADLYIGNKLIVVENSTPNLGATTIGDGGVTHYLAIAADGEIVLHGTARVTRHIYISPAILKLPAANYPSTGLVGLFPTLDYDAGATDESAYTEVEVPFRWDSSTDIEVEIAWTYEGSQDDGFVVWGIEYKGVKAGEAVTGAGTSITQKSAGTHTTGQMVRTTFSTKVLHGNIEADDDLGVRVYRHSSDGANDTLAVDAKLINVHLHMIMNKLGQPT